MTTEREKLAWFGILEIMKVFMGPHTVQRKVFKLAPLPSSLLQLRELNIFLPWAPQYTTDNNEAFEGRYFLCDAQGLVSYSYSATQKFFMKIT